MQFFTLGLALRTARRAAGLTQVELAELIGSHRNVVASVEAGGGAIATVASFAAALGLAIAGCGLPPAIGIGAKEQAQEAMQDSEEERLAEAFLVTTSLLAEARAI